MRPPSPEFHAFTNLVCRVLAVPHSEIQQREAEYRKQSGQNPRRRGPKRKATKKPDEAPVSGGRA